MTTKVAIGDRLVVLVHPVRNGGDRLTAGIVTAVAKDGTVGLQLLLPGESPRVDGVHVYEGRTAAEKALAEHFELLPGHSRDDEGNLIPGTNPTNGRPWQDYDVLHWVTVAWPAAPHPAVQELAVQHDALASNHRSLDERVRQLELAGARGSSTSSSTPGE